MKKETYINLIIDYLTLNDRKETIENLKALKEVAFNDSELTSSEALSLDRKISDILKTIKGGK